MAAFKQTSGDMGRLDYLILRDSPIALYSKKDNFENVCGWFRSHSYRVYRFDCTEWIGNDDEDQQPLDIFDTLYELLGFPAANNGYNIDALRDDFMWRLAEHWQTACEVMLHDPDIDCRFRAADDLGALEMNRKDARTLKVLAQVVCNEQEVLIVREAAYAAMKSVLHYEPKEQFHMATRKFDILKEAGWNMVKQYFSEEGKDEVI